MKRDRYQILLERVELELRDLQGMPAAEGRNAAAESERRNGRIAALQDVRAWIGDPLLEDEVDDRLAQLAKPPRRLKPTGKAPQRKKRKR